MAHILLKKHLDFLSTNTKERVWIFLTKKDRGFSVGLGERVGCILFRVDDESSINSCPEPRTVCMPPECAFLALDREPIGVAPPGPDRTLSYELRAICPRSPHLSHSMPDHREHNHNRTHQTSTHLNMNVHKFLNIYVCVCAYVYVPVNCDIVFGSVHDIDHEAVAIPDLNGWPGEHSVHCNDLVSLAEPLHPCLLDLNPIQSLAPRNYRDISVE